MSNSLYKATYKLLLNKKIGGPKLNKPQCYPYTLESKVTVNTQRIKNDNISEYKNGYIHPESEITFAMYRTIFY